MCKYKIFKFLIASIFMLQVSIFSSCDGNDKSNEKNSNNQLKKNVEYVFDNTWYRIDEVERLSQLTLNSYKNSISYYFSAAGNAVDDFDLYEKYEFDEKSKTIIAKHVDNKSNDITIKILRVEENNLELSFNNEIRKFYSSEKLAEEMNFKNKFGMDKNQYLNETENSVSDKIVKIKTDKFIELYNSKGKFVIYSYTEKAKKQEPLFFSLIKKWINTYKNLIIYEYEVDTINKEDSDKLEELDKNEFPNTFHYKNEELPRIWIIGNNKVYSSVNISEISDGNFDEFLNEYGFERN